MKLAGLKGFLQPKPVHQIINKAAAAMAEHLDALDQQLRQGGGPGFVAHNLRWLTSV